MGHLPSWDCPEPGILSQQESGGAMHFFHGFIPVLWDVTGCSLPWLTVVLLLHGKGTAVSIDPRIGICQCWALAATAQCQHSVRGVSTACPPHSLHASGLWAALIAHSYFYSALLHAGLLCRPHLLYRLSCCLPNSGRQNQNFKRKTMVQSKKKKSEHTQFTWEHLHWWMSHD